MVENIKNNPDELRRLYYKEGLTLREIGERAGVAASTIMRWLDEYGIERRNRGQRTGPISLTHGDDYPEWQHKVDGRQHTVRVHQLLAIAEFGYEATANAVVHHKNGVPWDNRPENIELVSRRDHLFIHRDEWDGKQKRVMSEMMTGDGNNAAKISASEAQTIRDRYDAGEDAENIAADFPVTASHIRNIGRREVWQSLGE